ncbi:MAG TPA: ABC transporter permease [Lysinibacillus sp.]|uniref:Cell division protein FtsX n=1 Tax=Lysinibacillus fusiformis TaxID=28031 RepID=A0A2I0V5N0_9BACI|nr:MULTISPECIES: permease-like cell division protein FtsX [Lysinibacillus]HBT72721.1 ABC transporter permease [Lysinibacillus sp.]KUF35275.1 cell division protein FtsX [Lysinibacillus sp. F5]MEE3807499.1 permease-like cell division protein FtsX [Lysinibacillus fusiformis]PKU53595.1 ABC transporter permease [Lysinibacillus fusiformis]WCH48444.1 permease-like cell division protein FtsX [Lysinibacillus sp. OF-1]
MKFNTVKRHFRESVKSLGRNSWMTIASVSAVTVTLILVGVFALIMMNLNKVATDLENDVEIKVLIDETADEAAEKALVEKVKKLPGVSEMTYSTKEDELTKLVKDFGDDFKLFEQSNPLRNVIYVKAADPQQTAKIAKAIDKYEYTYDVMYGEGKVEKLFNFLNISRNVGIVLILGLLFTAIFLISNTIRITIIARRDEIEIMKLVGATNSFVRIPFLLEGMWLGILGSIIPIAVVTTLYHNVYKIIAPRLQGELIQLLDFSPLVYQVSGLLLLIGVLIGVWGSFMSVRKFLKI